MGFDRAISKDLLRWKEGRDTRPLVLYGARQVGKTFSVKEFGLRHFDDMAYFNIEFDSTIRAVFEQDYNPVRIIADLSARHGRVIEPAHTLMVFDEVQRSNHALTSLKYFAENAPQYQIIATGSMLGLSIGAGKYSFPVGNVRIVQMFPLRFDEFLCALGKEGEVEHIRECYAQMRPSPFHSELLALHRLYTVVGGLPRVLSAYLQGNDVMAAQAEQTALDATYVSDMAQYLDADEAGRALEAWRSIPGQLAKDNPKFQYSKVRSGGRAYRYEGALAWLCAAGLIEKCVRSSEGRVPLLADDSTSYFKAYLFDVGILCSKLLRDPSALLLDGGGESLNPRFRGALSENAAFQALRACGIEAWYWESKGKAQIDFLIQDARGNAIPIEVKSADNVHSKSLAVFMEKYRPPYALRVSTKGFGQTDTIKSIPPYALFCLADEGWGR